MSHRLMGPTQWVGYEEVASRGNADSGVWGIVSILREPHMCLARVLGAPEVALAQVEVGWRAPLEVKHSSPLEVLRPA